MSYRQIIPIGLGLGVLLSVALFLSVVYQEYSYAIASFHLEARSAASAVQQNLEYGTHDFAAARSLYLASSEVTRSEFTKFIDDQLESNPLPGLTVLEWIPFVPHEQRGWFEQRAHDDGLVNFYFTEWDKEGRLVRASERGEYYPVYYVAPQDESKYTLGFDLGSDATRLASIQQARDTGRPVVTGPVVLVQSPTDAVGSLIFLPIYGSPVVPATVAERRQHLRGFLLGVFDLQALLTAGQGPETAAAHDMYLMDESLPPEQQLIFSSTAGTKGTPGVVPTTRKLVAGLDGLRSGIHHAEEVQIADQTWELLIVPGPGQIEGKFSLLPLVALLAVLAFSTLATAYVARRRQVRDILQRSEEQYRLVVDNLAEVIWAVDVEEMKLRFVTPSVLGLCGYTVEEVLQQPLEQLMMPESNALVRSVLPQRIAAAEGFIGPYVDEFALLCRDGSVVWTETTSHYAVDAVTQQVRIYGVSRDITERRRIERTQRAQFAVSRILAQSPKLQEVIIQVLESLTVGMDWLGAEYWQRAEDGSRLEWYGGWCRPDCPEVAQFLRQSATYTFTRGQGLIGRAWQDNHAVWENDLDAHPEYPRHVLGIEAGLKSAVCAPVCINDETVGVMVFHDASVRPVDDWLLQTLVDLGRQIGQFLARKQAEINLHNERASLAQRVQERTADLSRANAELAQALSAKNEFLANMSHELRTPLNGVLMMAESLHEGTYGPLNSRQQQSMKLIEQSGQHLLALINDVLDLAKVEAGKLDIQLEQVSAFAVAQASMALVQEMASKKSIRLAFGCNDSDVTLRADARRLKQILVNLLGNAIKFTPSGGHVNLTVTARPKTNEIEFAVQDDGIGIPPAEQAKLFQPFTQLDASLARHYEGTGLGLALVRRLAELHQGRVSVESTGIGGQGSRFIIILPWEDTVPHSTTPTTGPAGAGPDAGILGKPASLSSKEGEPPSSCVAKILVVDDNELNLLALKDYLTSAGFQLAFAKDGEEAVLQAQKVEPDLILMDIQMPKMSGVEATKHLRADPRFADTPILAMTALAMPGDRELCLEAGANDYISKPFLLKELVKTINLWLESTRRPRGVQGEGVAFGSYGGPNNSLHQSGPAPHMLR